MSCLAQDRVRSSGERPCLTADSPSPRATRSCATGLCAPVRWALGLQACADRGSSVHHLTGGHPSRAQPPPQALGHLQIGCQLLVQCQQDTRFPDPQPHICDCLLCLEPTFEDLMPRIIDNDNTNEHRWRSESREACRLLFVSSRKPCQQQWRKPDHWAELIPRSPG